MLSLLAAARLGFPATQRVSLVTQPDGWQFVLEVDAGKLSSKHLNVAIHSVGAMLRQRGLKHRVYPEPDHQEHIMRKSFKELRQVADKTITLTPPPTPTTEGPDNENVDAFFMAIDALSYDELATSSDVLNPLAERIGFKGSTDTTYKMNSIEWFLVTDAFRQFYELRKDVVAKEEVDGGTDGEGVDVQKKDVDDIDDGLFDVLIHLLITATTPFLQIHFQTRIVQHFLC